ncbi:MAG: hypothetical protein L6R39_002621 [Caloplaca ligustica]|nr:MAG: hypothetical protein L6R39_002621 [Caloplaca ligustica]
MVSPTSPPHFPLQELCSRAISSPSSITPAEKALLQARPNPDIENSLYIARTSLPLSGLIAKTLADPPTLSPQEAHVLVYGPVDYTPAEKLARGDAYHGLTDEQRDLLNRATRLITDPEEDDARNVAWRVLQRAKAEEKARQKAATASATQPDDQQGARFTRTSTPARRKPIVFPWERADWITLVREKNYTSWGLPVLRTAYNDPAAWLSFKTKLSALAAREIAHVAGSPLAETFEIKYVEDEDALAGAEQAGLLSYYSRLLQERKLEDGYSWGVFLTADDSVLEIFGEGNRELVVPVWEAAWKAGEVGAAGWGGALAMRAELIFGILIPKLVRGDKQPLEDLAMMAQDR